MKKVWSDAKTKPELKKLYLSIIPEIRKIARDSGYAIGIHGSMTRDLDLMAVPWVKKHVQPLTLAVRIHKGISKYSYSRNSFKLQNGIEKPCGREAYVLPIGHYGAYIDLSII